MLDPYDFILAGGGVSGLSLACQLASRTPSPGSILVIEKDEKNRNDCTLCYWTNAPLQFESIACRTWDQIRLVDPKYDRVIPLGRYRYSMVRGIDFYQEAHRILKDSGKVTFCKDSITDIRETSDGVRVCTKKRDFLGRWVFDSRPPSAVSPTPSAGRHPLYQRFQGWEVNTPHPSFDPGTPIFMDFRLSQQSDLRFFYVLPFTESHALVELVWLNACHPEQEIRKYLEQILRIPEYRMRACEGGTTPLSGRVCPRRLGGRMMSIGILGGRVKPTTGFAFQRIQRDSKNILHSLETYGHPFGVPESSLRFRLCDSLLLEIMGHHPEKVSALLADLLRKNPIDRVFRFLDEETSLGETLQIMAGMPKRIFLEAWIHWITGKKF